MLVRLRCVTFDRQAKGMLTAHPLVLVEDAARASRRRSRALYNIPHQAARKQRPPEYGDPLHEFTAHLLPAAANRSTDKTRRLASRLLSRPSRNRKTTVQANVRVGALSRRSPHTLDRGYSTAHGPWTLVRNLCPHPQACRALLRLAQGRAGYTPRFPASIARSKTHVHATSRQAQDALFSQVDPRSLDTISTPYADIVHVQRSLSTYRNFRQLHGGYSMLVP